MTETTDFGWRSLKVAATTITATAAAASVMWAGFVWLVEPRLTEWLHGVIAETTAELVQDSERTAAHLDRMDAVVEKLEDNVVALAASIQRSAAPSWRFDLPETSISDGSIGGVVRINAAGYKLRECGIPRVDLYFINGGGIYHRFEAASLLTADSRGVAFPVAPDRVQSVTYTARIPADDNVSPGRAQGFIAVTYPDNCPEVEEVVAGPLQFRILPEQG